MEYRREIDGLRALAVLPVLLFHAGFDSFRGGFVGVDVFFVISGYLITSIILSEFERGKFSVAGFYERRARRILPALFVVMFACLPFAWIWMLPGTLKDFAQSLIAVSVSASNILFWLESGYFDTAAEFKPLLHTWSLGVEEQFYVLFPLFLMLIWPLGKRWALTLLAVVGLASLAIAQWASLAKPAAAFFLLPTRIWELLIGALLAAYLAKSGGRPYYSRALSEWGGWIGLLLILYSIFSFSKATPFPGVYALIPTVGAALIILCATGNTVIGRIIGNRVFVGIGLISYSTYLWHQPLFAFLRHSSFEETKLVFSGLIIISLALAYLTWRYVERPFRDKKRFSRRAIFGLSLAGTCVFIGIGMPDYERTVTKIEPTW